MRVLRSMSLLASDFEIGDLHPDVARVVRLMAEFPRRWALCGGWAVDAWLGYVSREHGDVDVLIFEEDQLVLREHLAGWQMVAHDDNWNGKTPIWPNTPIPAVELWTGRHVDVPGHFHVRSDDNFDFEVNLNRCDGEEWVLNKDPLVSLPIDDCIGESRWGVPAATPALVAYYKLNPAASGWSATGVREPRMRPKDEADVEALLPLLSPEMRGWLGESINKVAPGHAWLDRM